MNLFEQYDKNLKNRIKAESIVLGFDDDASRTFSKFINLSNARFKAVKYGEKLDYVLNKQKPSYTKINSDIQNDVVYTTEYITSEKKKFSKSVNHFCIKKINKLRDKLIDSLKTKTKGDLRVMEKIKKKKKYKNLSTFYNLRKKNVKFLDKCPSINENEQINEEKYNTFSPNEELDEDYEKLSNGIKLYQKLLNDEKNYNFENINKSKEDKNVKIFKKKIKDIESSFSINNIKFLSYTEQKPKVRVKKKEIDESFDINNLLKLKYMHQNLQYLNPYNPNNDTSQTFTNEPSTIKNNFSESSAYSNSKMLTDGNIITKNNFDTMNLNFNISDISKINKPELKNTIHLIKYEAEKGKSLFNNFGNKIEKFNLYFNKYFPTKDISNKEKEIKLRFRKRKKDEKIYKPKFNVDNFKRKITSEKKLINEEKIIESFRKVYEEKIKKWNKSYTKKKLEDEMNIKRSEEFNNFLMGITK